MLTDKRRIKRYKKAVIILALVLSLFMFAILFFTIGVAASQLFEAQTSMDIIYIAESMDGNMSLKGYYKGDGESSASWHSLLVASISDTNHESIQLDINNPSPTQGVVNINTATLNSGNSYIVFECAFKNNGSKMVKMEFTDPETTMSNLTKTQLISRSALSSSDFDTIVDSPSAYSSLAVTGDRDTGNYIDDYIYYYVKLELTDTAQAAQYITSHTWTFSTNYSSSDVVTVSVNNEGVTGGIS